MIIRGKHLVLILLCVLVSYSSNTKSQNKIPYPEVGSLCPEFKLSKVISFKNSELSSKDLAGDFYILDFWTMGCASCISNFPKMEALQKMHKDRLKIVLIGCEEKNRNVKAFYEKYKLKFNLSLTSAFDSTTFKQFVPHGVPHLIWVNNLGEVKAITTSDDVTLKNIDLFLNNKPFVFYDRSYKGIQKREHEVDMLQPLLINGNGGDQDKYLYRSILSSWKTGLGKIYVPSVEYFILKEKGMYQAVGASILKLYKVAFFGVPILKSRNTEFWPWPEVETKDSLLFSQDEQNSTLYNYSVELPSSRSNKETIMRKIQGDLEIYFGYRARLIEKEMPCLKLIIIDSLKVKAISVNTGQPSNTWNTELKTNKFNSTYIDNLPIIFAYRLPYKKLVALNETGLQGRVTLSIDGDIENIEDIRSSLKRYGLDFVLSTRKFKVLEITDN